MSAAAVVAFLLGVGATPAALEGRWVAPRSKRVVELLPGGTMVVMEEAPGWRSVRRPDGAFENQPISVAVAHAGSYRLLGGRLLDCSLISVGHPESRREVPVARLDPSGKTLTLVKDRVEELYAREDPDLSPAQKNLVGLWRRLGRRTDADMGVLFTPGGIEIAVGRTSRWDSRSSDSGSGALCGLARYAVKGNHTLEEERLSALSERPRTRVFKVTGSQLTIRPPSGEDLVYWRVRGGLPVEKGRIDTEAWWALP